MLCDVMYAMQCNAMECSAMECNVIWYKQYKDNTELLKAVDSTPAWAALNNY